MELINWIERWYASHCDGDWEHQYGIEITTLDNPGWCVRIDLEGTDKEGLEIAYTLIEKSDGDWLSYKIANKIFEGCGDPKKLGEILMEFKKVVESN